LLRTQIHHANTKYSEKTIEDFVQLVEKELIIRQTQEDEIRPSALILIFLYWFDNPDTAFLKGSTKVEIHQKLEKLTIGIANAQQEISLLREFRTRLIADIVTGKLDVRDAAAHLPAELDELEPLEDDLPDPELDLDADSDLEAVAEEEAA
jgi:hypothetical protein